MITRSKRILRLILGKWCRNILMRQIAKPLGGWFFHKSMNILMRLTMWAANRFISSHGLLTETIYGVNIVLLL